MLVHKGGKIKNWGGECRDVTPTKSLSQGGGGGGGVGGREGSGWGGQGGCDRRIEVFGKIHTQKKSGGGGVGLVGGGGGGGGGVRVGGVRVDVNEELKFL